MKKGKVLTKNHIAVFFMVLALAAAVWLNMRYSGDGKYLGEAKFVSNKKSSETVETAAKVKESASDYFATAIEDREKAYEKAEETVEEALKSASITPEEKEEALKQLSVLSNRIAAAQNIESILTAKGFNEVVAILGEDSANIVVKSEGLTTEQTLQIEDTVTTQTSIPIGKVKIVTVK